MGFQLEITARGSEAEPGEIHRNDMRPVGKPGSDRVPVRRRTTEAVDEDRGRSGPSMVDEMSWAKGCLLVALHDSRLPRGSSYTFDVRLLLISTYELGRQPIHLASPAAALRAAGHEVSTIDTAVEDLGAASLDSFDAVAVSVPMHTAMRLAIGIASQIRSVHADLPIAFYGLYAGVGKEHTLGAVADRLFAGEYESELVEWASSLNRETSLVVDIGKTDFLVPDRSTLPPLSEYARLEWEGEARLVGAVEASHGCRHRCRHCPIPVLYDGRMRVVGAKAVIDDIDQMVNAGVQHVTFGDPDFLNAPRYSADLLRQAHLRHPDLTFDVTVKVSHILQHRDLWSELSELGLLFVVSAFETVEETTLEILDKNHTVADMRAAVGLLRAAGIFIRPTWLPFFPWTTTDDIVELVRFLDEMSLWEATDPVQLAIKLLIPEGSLLEKHTAVVPHLDRYEPTSLTWEWAFADPEAELLHKELDALAAAGSDCGAEALTTLGLMREAVGRAAGADLGPMPSSTGPVPHLTESWFCCAEPTAGQAAAIGLTIGRVPGRSSR